MRSQFPRLSKALYEEYGQIEFQSQMRSQFPRHSVIVAAYSYLTCVSISDEKPVPAPQRVELLLQAQPQKFQSQMRSQFPRHAAGTYAIDRYVYVSISDEKPVPAPPGCHQRSSNGY